MRTVNEVTQDRSCSGTDLALVSRCVSAAGARFGGVRDDVIYIRCSPSLHASDGALATMTPVGVTAPSLQLQAHQPVDVELLEPIGDRQLQHVEVTSDLN